MDPGAGVVALGFFATVAVLGTNITRAIANRGGGRAQTEVSALRDEVEQLRGELEAMHGRMAELDDVQNRLDFAERLLAQVKDRQALPGAR